ncbi:MAG TPA: GAF and ANTAR domain-containing protein [Nocardioidaceae bacterium]
MATIMYAADDFHEIYRAACSAATFLVSGCDHASLMLMKHGHPVTVAASDDIAREVDRLERKVGNGPCLDAIQEDVVYIDSDITHGTPWPELSALVLDETPVRGMAGFRLLVDDHKEGALNLFSDTAGRLTQASINEAILLVSFVSVALTAASQRQEVTTLRTALATNREIGKAVGLMMAFHKMDDQEAFALLRKTSQDMNIKIAEVAREIVTYHNKRGIGR